MAAGIREPVTGFVAAHAGYRLIDGRFMEIRQAVGTAQTKRPETTRLNGPSLLVPLRLVPAVKKFLTPFRARLRGHGGTTSHRACLRLIALRQRYSGETQLRPFSGIWPGETTAP